MKKTVQIVTIPLQKEGWAKGDLIFDRNEYYIADNTLNAGVTQQLLVLSDDEILESDCVYDIVSTMVFKPIGVKPHKNCRKIIAAYPTLDTCLSISKETVQAWIDAGTPGEGSVEEWVFDALSYYDPALSPFKTDTQGNLLLEFPGEKLEATMTEAFIKMATSATGSAFVTPEFAAIGIPSIPTQEEIEIKPYEKINDMASEYAQEKCRIMDSIACLTARKTAYIDGYQQALKDLGYENK